MAKRLDASSADFASAFEAVLADKREQSVDVSAVVGGILADVRARGNAALFDLTAKFDGFTLGVDNLTIQSDEVDAAVASIDAETLEALELAAERIFNFHARQIPGDLEYTDRAGVRLGYQWTPVGSAGLYVPGGLASYPSSVLMNAIPAKVAGVERLVMVVPTPNGEINPLVLAAAKTAGVDEIYRIGGAQAVGALAFGTESITAVDVIVGPGNAYVAEAKRQVFGRVGIDMIAGPSEILVVADEFNEPELLAMDLLSQAEHDPVAQSILLTDSAELADKVERAVATHLETLPRREIAGASWRDFGVVIVVGDLNTDAGEIIDRIAPEHLELAVLDPDAMLQTFSNAGAVFLGRHTPEAIGDYVAGPNHVLPTARSAKFSSGLGVINFLKRTTLIACDEASLKKIGPAAVTLAKAEGLDAHALSVSLRLGKDNK